MRKNEVNFAILLSNKIFLNTLKRIALSATNASAMLPRTSDNQWAATITLDKDTIKANIKSKVIVKPALLILVFLNAKEIQTKNRLNIVAACPLGKLLYWYTGSK